MTVNAYRPGSVDTAMQAWIRDPDPDAIGRALQDRFTEGDLITPDAFAAALIRRLDGDATGEIWDVADDPSSQSWSTQGTITRLHLGDTFPSLTITPANGQPLELPGALAGHFGVVLLYRGGWCPYCNAQLRAFRRAAEQLADLDIRVVALSVDDEATTRQTIAKHGLEFSVGHGADADAVAAATGAFVNDAPRYLQSTGFVLDPEGQVIVSVYSQRRDRPARARGRHRPHQACARARGRRAGGMSGALVEREQRAICRISEAACVRPGR